MGTVSDDKAGARSTHVEDLKDPVEVGLPNCNSILVVPRVKHPRDFVPPALFGDLPLYFRDGPAVENAVSRGSRIMHHQFDSRHQLIYRITHRLAEVV